MPASSAAGKQFGRYELLAHLAAGGTAEVYLARIVGEAGFEKIVVVKRLLEHLAEDREFVDMFLDEAKLGARLDHSNIVQTLELGQVDGRYFIAMEYVAGLSMAHLAGKAQQRVAGGLPLDLSLGLIAQAAAGLHHAHECALSDGTPLKIVHRDVSPQNLVVTFEGEVKIVDFGIAHAAQREAHTKSGFIKGKFAYMAPEQCLGKPLDRRTDIFALGVICWELATGRRLFKRESTYATYQAIVKGDIPAPTRVNRELEPSIDELIMRALTYQPEQRYQTSEEFLEAIHSYLHRRGKRAATGDVARFIEKWFQPEIEEHAGRISALMSGTSVTIPAAAWDAEEIIVTGTDEEWNTSVDAAPSEPLAPEPLPPVPTGPTRPVRSTPPATVAVRPSAARPAVPVANPDAATFYPLPGATPSYPPPPPRPASGSQPVQSGRPSGNTPVPQVGRPSGNTPVPQWHRPNVDVFARTEAAMEAQATPPLVLNDTTHPEGGPTMPGNQGAPSPYGLPPAMPVGMSPAPGAVAPGMTPQPIMAQPALPAISPGVLTPSSPSVPLPLADGSYTDAQRLAQEGRPPRLWIYPVVFLLAAGVGVGVLLLIDRLR